MPTDRTYPAANGVDTWYAGKSSAVSSKDDVAIGTHVGPASAGGVSPESAFEGYTPIHKIDSPSGTALDLSKEFKNKIEIESIREGEICGIHVVNFKSQNDSLQIKHESYSRDGFALGAVLAAEWIENKIGIFTINEMLNIKNI